MQEPAMRTGGGMFAERFKEMAVNCVPSTRSTSPVIGAPVR